MELPVMDWVDVSPEMVSFVGMGTSGNIALPMGSVAFAYDFGNASFRFTDEPDSAWLDVDADQNRIIFAVTLGACRRLLGRDLTVRTGISYHLPANMRAIAMSIRDCALPEAARVPYRLAKSIELLCETLELDRESRLIPVDAAGNLSRADSERLLAARRVIEERWAEKLTLDSIARSCGLNRAKLTRGFRDLFDCSVADAIAETRLGEASNMLVATDLPVSSIGYRCGYLNNASFARAFSRHFGVAPTQYRAAKLAA